MCCFWGVGVVWGNVCVWCMCVGGIWCDFWLGVGGVWYSCVWYVEFEVLLCIDCVVWDVVVYWCNWWYVLG